MTSSATSPSVLEQLYRGRVPWELLTPFPEQDPADRPAGDRAVAALGDLLRARLDAEVVEASGRLPDGFLAELDAAGMLRLMVDPELGGLGLSWLNACRVVEAAASWSMSLAFVLSSQNGFGSSVYLQTLPPGPLRTLIGDRVARGIVSGVADAEVAGAANDTRTTVAVPVDGGAAYELTGEKLYVGNGAAAGFLDVSATLVGEDGEETVRMFFVDCHSPGFEVVHTHGFMGLRGAPFGVLRLDRVRVPAAQLMPELGSAGWRMREAADAARGTVADDPAAAALDLRRLAALGRHLIIGPPALAVARSCLLWSREFVGRRTVDGRPLGSYEEVRRTVDETVGDLFAIESIQLWCLLAGRRADTVPDLGAAKNLTSLAAWRTADRTVALLGGEGYETAASKRARGAAPWPVERCFRDARALRVAGGVDSMMDRWSAEANLRACYYAETGGAGAPVAPAPGTVPATGRRAEVEAHAARLGETCRALTRIPSAELFARQRTVGVVGRIAAEILGMAIVVARAAGCGTRDDAEHLAEAACASAGRRLPGLWAELEAEPAAPPVRDWLGGTGPDLLAGDVLAGPGSARPVVEPAPSTGAVVAAVWRELFAVPEIGSDDDFFSLGGHSMLAVRMAARLRTELGLRVPVRTILENPTLDGLSLLLARAVDTTATPTTTP